MKIKLGSSSIVVWSLFLWITIGLSLIMISKLMAYVIVFLGWIVLVVLMGIEQATKGVEKQPEIENSQKVKLTWSKLAIILLVTFFWLLALVAGLEILQTEALFRQIFPIVWLVVLLITITCLEMKWRADGFKR